MDEAFWQQRWRTPNPAFHEGRPNDRLVQHVSHLGLKAGDTVFVPLCGKAVDLDWLRAQGLHVVGVEYNQGAVEEVFERQDLSPKITQDSDHTRYAADGFTLFVGDFFGLTEEKLGRINAVYDRAALVALTPALRAKYATHIGQIAPKARQLILTFGYDPDHTNGPPHSVSGAEIVEVYGTQYEVALIMNGHVAAFEPQTGQDDRDTWLLSPK